MSQLVSLWQLSVSGLFALWQISIPFSEPEVSTFGNFLSPPSFLIFSFTFKILSLLYDSVHDMSSEQQTETLLCDGCLSDHSIV